MLEKFKRSLDDAFHGIKTGASKVSLKAEEKTKITRLNLKVTGLKKELDRVMAKLGSRVYTFREEQHEGNVFQDPAFSDILQEADNLKGKVTGLQEEMNRIREDYEARIQGLDIPEGAETTEAEEKAQEAGEERKIS